MTGATLRHRRTGSPQGFPCRSLRKRGAGGSAQHRWSLDAQKLFPVALSRRPYPIPSRTRKSSSSEPMVLHGLLCGRVGRCRANDGVRAERFGPRSFFVARRRALEGSARRNAPCLPEVAELEGSARRNAPCLPEAAERFAERAAQRPLADFGALAPVARGGGALRPGALRWLHA